MGAMKASRDAGQWQSPSVLAQSKASIPYLFYLFHLLSHYRYRYRRGYNILRQHKEADINKNAITSGLETRLRVRFEAR